MDSSTVVDNLSAATQAIGKYDLMDKIAEGGMGTVYRARHHESGDVVAIKVVPKHFLSNPVVLKRFEQEYNVAKLIDHPNIVKALECGQHEDTRYLVMEYVEGESLGQKIERDGPMSEADAIKIVSQVALGLQKAHKQGVIHRDVKPDNILLTPDGKVKLTDLGLVKELEADHNLTRTGRGLGTPHFMAPEQFRNAKKADARCDIYSLGATLYMMVTGILPFDSNGPLDAWMKKINNEIDAPRKRMPGISERVDWAIRRALSPDPASRPSSCREFIEDLTGHSTRNMPGPASSAEAAQEFWYLYYTDDAGEVHTVKGSVKGIRRSLKDRLLGDPERIRVARSKAGPFEPLRAFPEFRDLIIQPENVPTPRSKAAALKSAAASSADSLCSQSAVLTATSIITVINHPTLPADKLTNPAKGPCINLKTKPAPTSAEWWKWVALGLFFAGAGVVATLALPLMRHIRL